LPQKTLDKNQPEGYEKNTNIMDLLDEIKRLKEENQGLKGRVENLSEENKKNSRYSLNVPTQNRFTILSTVSPILETPNEEMDIQDSPDTLDILSQLKKKNSQQEINDDNRKNAGHRPKEDRDIGQPGNLHTMQPKDQQTTGIKAKRKDRPPPINILHQDPKDTATLIKTSRCK